MAYAPNRPTLETIAPKKRLFALYFYGGLLENIFIASSKPNAYANALSPSVSNLEAIGEKSDFPSLFFAGVWRKTKNSHLPKQSPILTPHFQQFPTLTM